MANFSTTDATLTYGLALASALGRFVIDTSRTGEGTIRIRMSTAPS